MNIPSLQLLLGVFLVLAVAADWNDIDGLVLKGIRDKIYPGASAIVYSQQHGILYHKHFGRFSYGEPIPYNKNPPPVDDDSIWDMASCTKTVATTSALAQFYERGELDLDTPIADPSLLGPAFAAASKGSITLRHVLLHQSGLPPDPSPNFMSKAFGCPASKETPPPETFSCLPRIHNAIMNQPVVRPPDTKYVYSDLSMMIGALTVGSLARRLGYVEAHHTEPDCASFLTINEADSSLPVDICYYRAYVARHVLGHQFDGNLMKFYVPHFERSKCPPQWNATDVGRGIIQGSCSDENSYAAGGALGHAGLFATSHGVVSFVAELMNGQIVNTTTLNTFSKVGNKTFSSRALGWDTNLKPGGYSCGSLSEETFLHLGRKLNPVAALDFKAKEKHRKYDKDIEEANVDRNTQLVFIAFPFSINGRLSVEAETFLNDFQKMVQEKTMRRFDIFLWRSRIQFAIINRLPRFFNRIREALARQHADQDFVEEILVQ
ncbi:hypothetical protein P9112_003922 [Eukaryota sp. TZLM1-RC]